jgi:hypothetical protein
MRPVQLPSKSFLMHHVTVILTQHPYSLGYWQDNDINHDTPIGVPFTERGDILYFYAVAYPGFFFGGGVQQIQLRTEDRENGDLGGVAP